MKILNNGIFRGCTSIYKIIISDKIEEIGSNLFSHSGLKEIIIEEGVKSIGNSTFYDCKNL